MSQENPIYFRLGYNESIESKKELLSVEMSLLNIIKSIRRYKLFREEEFKIKSEVYKSIKELNLKMRKTMSSFPFLKIPEKTKREKLKENVIKIRKEKTDDKLEMQLREIQEKLRAIER